MTGALADGRLLLARSNIRVALGDLDALKARVAERDICDDGWQMHVDMAFGELDCLLREALEALK